MQSRAEEEDFDQGQTVSHRFIHPKSISVTLLTLKVGWQGKFFFGLSESVCLKTYLSRIEVRAQAI